MSEPDHPDKAAIERIRDWLDELLATAKPEPSEEAQGREWEITYGLDSRWASSYYEMREMVKGFCHGAWLAAGQPLVWPGAGAEERRWRQVEPGLREILLPDGTVVTVREVTPTEQEAD